MPQYPPSYTPLQLHSASRFRPNFQGECRECGTSPTVIVVDHPVPETDLCGWHFFADRSMIDWQLWNDDPEDTE